MIDLAHHCDLVKKTFSISLILGEESIFFGEGLDSKQLTISDSLNLIDSSESSLPEFPQWLEGAMEPKLIDIFAEIFDPNRQKMLRNYLKFHIHGVFFE